MKHPWDTMPMILVANHSCKIDKESSLIANHCIACENEQRPNGAMG